MYNLWAEQCRTLLSSMAFSGLNFSSPAALPWHCASAQKGGEKKFNSGFFHLSEATWGITEHLHENEHLERKTVYVL